jgi:phosphatidylglycerophosphate synthase
MLAPVVILLALLHPSKTAFGICLIIAFLSDIFDGIIARRLNMATPALRRFDSAADSVFYIAALFAAWRLYPAELDQHLAVLGLLVALELVRYAVDFVKFRQAASYHMWSSKLWGICLFVGFFSLLAMGRGGLPVSIAIYAGIVADLEGLAISCVLRKQGTDVASLLHALRTR